jgi:hypothetical protein
MAGMRAPIPTKTQKSGSPQASFVIFVIACQGSSVAASLKSGGSHVHPDRELRVLPDAMSVPKISLESPPLMGSTHTIQVHAANIKSGACMQANDRYVWHIQIYMLKSLCTHLLQFLQMVYVRTNMHVHVGAHVHA